MLFCRRLSSIATGRAQHIRHRTFFSQPVLKQTEVTTPGDSSVPPCQASDDANQDTPVTHPAETFGPRTIPNSAKIAAFVYDRKRQKDPEVALDLISDQYVEKLRKNVQKQRYHRVRTLIDKIILSDTGDETTRANKLHFALVSVPLSKLPSKMVVPMLRMVTTSLGQKYHSTTVVDRIIPLIMTSSFNSARELVDLIFPSLLFNLQKIKPQEVLTGAPSPFVLASFTLLHWLLPRSQEKSVALYKILVESGHVPSTSLQDENVKSGTLNTLIYAPSIKTCFERGWTGLAVEFLDDYLKSGDGSKTLGIDLSLELVGYLLDCPSEKDLYLCCNLIERLHRTFEPVPDEIIHNFYSVATQSNLGRPAERLYLFTRDMRKDNSRPHNYPLPQGRSLVWLAEDLVRNDSTRPHFESLVNEAHEQRQDVSIPASHRPSYLKVVAEEGFGLIAQSLWKEWAQGVNGEVIRGSPQLLVRMIRLTRSMTRKQEERLIALEKCEPPNAADIEASRGNLDAISSFAHKVLRAYISRHEPLPEADHIVLTSLARAHLVLGNVPEGFFCFRLLMRRLERPDIVDVNVGLTALAEHEPRAAAAFAATMVHYDIKPDATTFSTIIHHAMIKDDLDLCTEIAVQMKEILEPKTNFQPFYSMVSASMVERSGDTPQRQITRLKAVLKVLRIMKYPVDKFIMHPEVGQSLIRASLPDYPEVAFEFWEMVSKGMPTNDAEYCSQVLSIRRALRSAWNRGHIEEIKMKEMLSKLLRD